MIPSLISWTASPLLSTPMTLMPSWPWLPTTSSSSPPRHHPTAYATKAGTRCARSGERCWRRRPGPVFRRGAVLGRLRTRRRALALRLGGRARAWRGYCPGPTWPARREPGLRQGLVRHHSRPERPPAAARASRPAHRSDGNDDRPARPRRDGTTFRPGADVTGRPRLTRCTAAPSASRHLCVPQPCRHLGPAGIMAVQISKGVAMAVLAGRVALVTGASAGSARGWRRCWRPRARR